MKKTTLALLTVTAAASMAGIANAVPFGGNDLPPGLNHTHDGPPWGLTSQSGSPPGWLNGAPGLSVGLSTQGGNNPLVALNTPLSTVPEGGTSLLFLGMGLVALTLWHRRWRGWST